MSVLVAVRADASMQSPCIASTLLGTRGALAITEEVRSVLSNTHSS